MGSFTTAIAGFVAMRVLDAKKDERTYQRERAARDDARRDKLRERHAEFQRLTLIDLQEAFLNLIHSAGAMHTNNSRIFGDGDWKDNSVYRPVELSVLNSEAQAKTMLLIGRVSDDTARELATKTKVACTLAYAAKDKREADQAMGHALQCFFQVNAQISKLLRELNQFPDAPLT